MNLPRTKVAKTILTFLGSYLLFLIIWVQVKDYYGMATVAIASNMVICVKDVKYEYQSRKGDTIEAVFNPLRYRAKALIGIPIRTSFYTFNVPLTLSIMLLLYPVLRRRARAYIEAFIILCLTHVTYVFSLEANELTNAFIMMGYEVEKTVILGLYQFLWGFTDNMIIRFEPFLIGVYLFLRYGGRIYI